MKVVLIDREFENGTPARVHRPSGTIFLPPSFFDHTEDEQKMILMHEVGHHVLQTSNESEADKFAAEQLVDELGSKRTFRALNNSLFMSPSSDARRINLFNHLKVREMNMSNYDINVLGNYSPDDLLGFYDEESGYFYKNGIVGEDFDEMCPEEATDFVNWCNYMGVECSDMTKKEYRAQKRQAKIDRKNAKTNKINAKADAKRTKADAKLVKANAKQTLAEQGIDASAGAKIKDALGGVANAAKNVLGGIFGGGGADDAGADAGGYGPDGQSAIEEPKKTNWLLIGGIGAAILAVAIVLIVVLKKKKK